MKKEDLRTGDIIEYRNGQTKIISGRDNWVIDELYGDDLNCVTDERYDIVAVRRPMYEVVYQKEKKNERSK